MLKFDCRKTLDQISEHKKANLVWVPAHVGIKNNENADEPARTGE